MTEKTDRTHQNNDVQNHLDVLKKMLDAAKLQRKIELAEALSAAIDALEKQEDSRESDELPLSRTASETLLELANKAKADSTASSEINRRNAIQHLTRLAKN